MAVFLVGFILCALASLGARDRLLVASLSMRLGGGAALPCAIWLAAITSSALAGWAALQVTPSKAPVLAPAALLLGAAELAALPPRRVPEEPTRSFGAIFLVLLAGQVLDPARLATFALALWTGNAVAATLGGILGSGIALTTATSRRAVREVRFVPALAAGVLLVSAGLMAFGARVTS